MTPKIDAAMSALIEALHEEAPDQMVSFNLFVNCESWNLETAFRSAEYLEKAGISMRNLRGEFIS